MVVEPAHIQFALELASVPMLLVSGEGKVLMTNAELDALFEYERGSLDGVILSVLVPKSVRRDHANHVSSFLNSPIDRPMGQGRILHGVTRLGNEVPLEIGIRPICLDGETCAIATVVDTRAQVSGLLRVKAAMEAAKVAMITVATDGRIMLVNRAAESLLGFDRAELLRLTVEDLVPKKLRHRHRGLREELHIVSSHDMSQARTIQIRAKNGDNIPVQIVLAPVDMPEGRQVMCTIIDQRARLAEEERILRHNQELSEKNTELAQFAYAISHDLKAPLSSIQGLLCLIEEDLASGKRDSVLDYLKNALEVCRRSRQKIETVLDLARAPEAFETSQIDLEQVLQRIWMGLIPGMTNDARMTIDLEISYVTGNEVALEAIFQNLLTNALTYRDPSRSLAEIRVSARRRGDTHVISVSDNGIGIAPEHRDQVFDLFRRLEKRSGDGIGLALVRKYTHRLGGDISLESETGIGTTFTLNIPA